MAIQYSLGILQKQWTYSLVAVTIVTIAALVGVIVKKTDEIAVNSLLAEAIKVACLIVTIELFLGSIQKAELSTI